MKSNLPPSRTVATGLQSPQYFTGIPCRHGHLAPRRTLNYVCLSCHRRWRRQRNGFAITGGEIVAQLAFPFLR